MTSKYRIVSYVGSGVYGQVVRARLSSDLSKTVVIKRTSDVFRWRPGFAKYALREIAIMRRLNHLSSAINASSSFQNRSDDNPAAPPLTPASADSLGVHGSSPMFKHLYVVLEDGGIDLKQFFLQQTGPLHIDQIKHISRQICAAVAYLQSCRVVHRDLKPANILIDPNPQSPTYLHVRIADFGASRSVELPPGADMPPPILAAAASSSPPYPRIIRKSKSEANFLASAADSEFRTIAGEDGAHACIEMGLQHMSISGDIQANGSGPM